MDFHPHVVRSRISLTERQQRGGSCILYPSGIRTDQNGGEVLQKRRPDRKPPDELFIHGKTTFNDEEWSGFRQAAPAETNIVGVKIRDDSSLKLFRTGDTPVLRGTAFVRNPRNAMLLTRGWTPRLGTYPGLE